MSKTDDRKDKLEATLATLHAEVAKLKTSDAWLEALAFAARFHTYSFHNVMLIRAQRPAATHVAGYRQWQALGRQVRKGESGIAILGPRFAKRKDEKTGEDKRVLVGFLVLSVFDVSQTEGEPLPSVHRVLSGDDPAGIYAAARALAEEDGWTVSDQPLAALGGANGYSTGVEGGRRIVVGAELAPAQRAKTMVHELAHVLLKHTDDHALYVRERNRCEVEAESVAYVVCSALGLDTAEYSVGYVAGWDKPGVLEDTGKRVLAAANVILSRLDAVDQADVPPVRELVAA